MTSIDKHNHFNKEETALHNGTNNSLASVTQAVKMRMKRAGILQHTENMCS